MKVARHTDRLNHYGIREVYSPRCVDFSSSPVQRMKCRNHTRLNEKKKSKCNVKLTQIHVLPPPRTCKHWRDWRAFTTCPLLETYCCVTQPAVDPTRGNFKLTKSTTPRTEKIKCLKVMLKRLTLQPCHIKRLCCSTCKRTIPELIK